tara:strand:+ start:517 stop:1092 length:576 start_codon:yes stop_codon:yes gene_type:complete
VTRIEAVNICICLSHEVSKDLELSYDSNQRLKKAAKIFKEKKLDYLVTTGWKYKEYLEDPLSLIMSEFAINKFDIPQSQILQLTKAKDTVGEAVFLKDLIYKRSLNVEKIYIVSSDWHIKRVNEIFSTIFANIDDPLLVYSGIKGRNKQKEKEEKNTSIKEFRKIIKRCNPGDFECIYKEVMINHPLYNQS